MKDFPSNLRQDISENSGAIINNYQLAIEKKEEEKEAEKEALKKRGLIET